MSSKENLNSQDEEGNTALIRASRDNKFKEVKRLINAGADLNVQGKDGSTALIWASYNRNKKIIELLINAGANLDIQDNTLKNNREKDIEYPQEKLNIYDDITKNNSEEVIDYPESRKVICNLSKFRKSESYKTTTNVLKRTAICIVVILLAIGNMYFQHWILKKINTDLKPSSNFIINIIVALTFLVFECIIISTFIVFIYEIIKYFCCANPFQCCYNFCKDCSECILSSDNELN